MNWMLLSIGLIVLFLAVTGVIGQGKLMVRYFGENNSRIVNIVVGMIMVIVSLFI